MNHTKKAIYTVIFCIGIIIVLIALNTIPLPLPDEDKGMKYVVDTIEKCEFYKLGNSSSNRHGVHIELKNFDSKKISSNFKEDELGKYFQFCNDKRKVRIEYYANRLLIRPRVTYWVNEIIGHHESL